MKRILTHKLFWFFAVMFLTLGIGVFSEYAPDSFYKTLNTVWQGWWGKKAKLPHLEEIFGYTVYYFLWVTVAFLALTWKEISPKEFFKDVRVPLFWGVVLASVVFLAIPTDFRVLADETNLLSTSLSLYLNKSLYNILHVLPYYDSLHIVHEELAARPALYPFLISLLHTLFGFHWYFGFVVNFFVGVLLITTVVKFGREIKDTAFGVTAGILVAAFPIFAITVTSTGFDTINAAFMTLVFVQIRRFLKEPNDRTTETLILLTILAAQCRYESILLVFPVGIAFLSRIKFVVEQRHSWRFPLLPFLGLPLLWQRILNKHVANAGDNNDEAFGLKYFWDNLEGHLRYFFKPLDNPNPTAFWILIIAVTGFVAFCVIHFAGKKRVYDQNVSTDEKVKAVCKVDVFWYALVLLGLALSAIIHLTYYFGNPEKPWISRLAVMYVPLIAVWAAYGLSVLFRMSSRPAMLILPAVFLLFHYLPVSYQNEAGKSLMLAREFKKIHAFFKDKPIDAQLIISGRPGMFAALGRGAVNYHHANSKNNKLLNDYARHLYTDIWVIQHVLYDTGEPEEEEELKESFILEPVFEFQNSAEEFVRISRVKSQPPLPQNE